MLPSTAWCFCLLGEVSWQRRLGCSTRLFTTIPRQKYRQQVQSEGVPFRLLLLPEQNRTCLRRQAARACPLRCFSAAETWLVQWFSSHSAWACFLLPWKIFCNCANQEENTYLKDRGICMQAAIQKSMRDLAPMVPTSKYYIQ